MKNRIIILFVYSLFAFTLNSGYSQINFSDNFNNGISTNWRWLDQDASAWNTNGGKLNMKRYPGHGFYSTDNNRVPILYYPGAARVNGLEAQVQVGFDVDRQYGQAGMIWWYDNNNWAKLVIEYWWDYGIHVVFLKEENGIPCHDKTVCEKDFYWGATSVEIKMKYDNGKFITDLRPVGSTTWQSHFNVNAIADKGAFNIGLFSQADAGSSDWSWFDNFSLYVPGTALFKPTITSQPTSATVSAGSNVSFSIQANGNPAPTYQWYKNSTAISGATSATYTMNNVQTANNGSYYCIASNSQGTATSNTASLTVNTVTQSPYSGSAIVLPAKIEAENYDNGGLNVAYYDNSTGNSGNQYRQNDVDIEACSEGGYNIGWTADGEWLEYTVSPAANSYKMVLRYAANVSTPGTVKVLLDGVTLGTFSTVNTNGWQNWQDATINNINLTAGSNKILRMEIIGSGININSLAFVPNTTDPAPTAPTNLISTGKTSSTVSLSWTASTDNIGVTGYDIFNSSALAGSVNGTTTTYTASGLSANTAYTFTVKAKDGNGNTSASSNAITITTDQNQVTPNIALNKTCTTSSAESTLLSGNNATDGNTATRWASTFSDPQWIYVDLGAVYNINRVVLKWEGAYGSAYKIQVSGNASSWTDIYSTSSGDGGTDDLSVSGTGRYIRMYGSTRATTWGYSLWEFEVYGTSSIADNESPSIPNGLIVSNITSTSLTLSWNASTDNIGVTSYDVLNGTSVLGTTTSISINLSSLNCNTSYNLSVKAKDAAGNSSAASSILQTQTSVCSTINKYEAENATRSGGGIATDHIGYSGTGFWAYVNTVGNYLQFNVTASNAGSQDISCRYSCAGNQKLSLYVNGTKIRQVTFAPTANWDTWADKVDIITLNTGSNTIKYQYDSGDNGGVNIDYISLGGAKNSQMMESEMNDIFIVYPNPASDFVQIINRSESKGIYKISILNSLGKEVFYLENFDDQNQNQFFINTSNFSTGMYFLNISNNAGKSNLKKLMIQR